MCFYIQPFLLFEYTLAVTSCNNIFCTSLLSRLVQHVSAQPDVRSHLAALQIRSMFPTGCVFTCGGGWRRVMERVTGCVMGGLGDKLVKQGL